MDTDRMNRCLRSELSAVETYTQALERERSTSEQETDFQQLASILNDHQQAASQIEAEIQRMGGTPVRDSGAWGTWSKLVMGTAKLLGDKAALKALKEGEESGLKEYQDVVADVGAPREAMSLCDSLIAKQQAHIRTLDNLMARL
jgi:Domain of unknown function (DUF2383)